MESKAVFFFVAPLGSFGTNDSCREVKDEPLVEALMDRMQYTVGRCHVHGWTWYFYMQRTA